MPDGLICWPASVPGVVVAGTTKNSCSRCGAPVWVSPSSQRILATTPLEIICVPCFGAGEATEIVLAPGQLQELSQVCGPETALKVASIFQPRPDTN